MDWKIIKESHYTPFADKVTIPFFKAYQLAYAERRQGKTRGAIGACPPTGGFSLIFCFFCIKAKEKA